MPDLKVTADHLQRDAYLYVRQSTLRQVAENGESTQRQYALRDRAIAAGWPPERIHVIDCDLGKSGANAIARDGFQELVSEVALAKAGIVMGLEVSRLARNSADWHRLLELCALTATLILDEDGVYDPASFNDRLLLGLKGTMSEAELHILRARMRGGQLNKARRGELEIGPPVGLVYRPDGSLDLDPDVEVQGALRLVFDTFERTGSAIRTVRFFLDQGILFPRRLRKEPNRGELLWAPPRHARILQVLHNPRYAGAFVYGRTRTRHRPDGRVSQIKVPMADWQFVMPDLHRGYIDWERFKPIRFDSPTTPGPTASNVGQGRFERDPPCSRAACFAACAASEWASATARNMVGPSQSIFARRPWSAAEARSASRFPARWSIQRSARFWSS